MKNSLKYKNIHQERQRCFKEILKIAAQGNRVAQLKIGQMYLMGDGVQRNPTQAYEWFLKSAKNGETRAEEAVGQMLCVGVGIPKDSCEGLKWLLKAVRSNPGNAQVNVANMLAEKEKNLKISQKKLDNL